MLSNPTEERASSATQPVEFGLRPPLDDHPKSGSAPTDDDRGWAAWLVIILLAAITLRVLMGFFGGGIGEVIAVFTGGEPAVVTAGDRTRPSGPIGVDAVTVDQISAGLHEPAYHATATRDGYSHLLSGAEKLGLPTGAVVLTQSLLTLGLIVLAFAVGRRFGGLGEDNTRSADRVGLIAAAVVAVHPAVLLAGASLEPTLWSATALLLVVYLLTGAPKPRVMPDGTTRRDWVNVIGRSMAAGVTAATAIALGGVDAGLISVLLVGLGIGVAWWVWQRERDHSRRPPADDNGPTGSGDSTAAAIAPTGRRHWVGLTLAVAVSGVIWVGLAGIAPGLIGSGGAGPGQTNDWDRGAATRLAWTTHNPLISPEANAETALALVRGEMEEHPDRSGYTAADRLSWTAVREAPRHTSWRLQRDAWRAAMLPSSGEVVSRFGVQPSGKDRVARWLDPGKTVSEDSGPQAAPSGVLTAVGLVWSGLNLALVVAACLGLALLTARRRWGEVVCLGLVLFITVLALVFGEGQRGAIGLLGLTACGWAAAGLVLPKRVVQRNTRRRRKDAKGPAGIAGAGGLLSVVMAVNPGHEDGEGETRRSWRNLWGWWSAGDQDSDNYRAVRLPLTGGQGLPVAPAATPDDKADDDDSAEASPVIPGVEVLEASIEEEPKLVAGGRPI
ncbi:MAG: hypothetical protein AAGI68_11915 [Planctomycetota bacterium]